jgi:hypothetical protein
VRVRLFWPQDDRALERANPRLPFPSPVGASVPPSAALFSGGPIVTLFPEL